jgi:hypothetical protein
MMGDDAPMFTVVVLRHPDASLYVIIVLPTLTPVTIPVTDPTVAIAVLPLLHVPPAVASDSVTDAPDGNVVLPVTGNILFTVTVA